MSFEVVPRGEAYFAEKLPEGWCSLARTGRLLLRAEDLTIVGISDACITLADAATLRIALRQVRDGEAELAMRVSMVRKHNKADSGRRGVNVARAVKALGLTLAAAAGRYELTTKGKAADGLLIVKLVDAKNGPREAA